MITDFQKSASLSSLWDSLTREEDPKQRWETFKFPVDLHPSKVHRTAGQPSLHDDGRQELVVDQGQLVTVNCTVAYMNQCSSMNKCWDNCESMGASSARWFADGCCECVGHHCPAYGVNESRCRGCSDDGDGDDDDDDDIEELSDEELEQKSDEELAELEKQYEDELYSDDSSDQTTSTVN